MLKVAQKVLGTIFMATIWVLLAILMAVVETLRRVGVFKRRVAPPGGHVEPVEFTEREGWNHRYIRTSRGTKLHIVCSGKVDGPLILCLHGFPESWYTWAPQLSSSLTKDHFVVAVDMPGYGESVGFMGEVDFWSAGEHFALPMLCEDIESIASALGRDAIDCLVGHDWGGAVSWAVAARSPALVRHLVIANAPHAREMGDMWARDPMSALSSWYMFFFLLPYLPEFFLAGQDFAAIDAIFKDHVSREEREVFKYTLSRPGALTGSINYYRAMTSKPSRREIARLWPSPCPESFTPSPVPTTIVWGMDDPYVKFGTVEAVGKWVQDVSFKKLEGVGHGTPTEAPKEITQAILEAMEK